MIMMKKLILSTALAATALFFSACAGVTVTEEKIAAEAKNEKNIIDAEYRDLPADYWNLLQREPEKWNFNFRPYDSQFAEILWSDSQLQRNVVVGADLEGKQPTALYVSFNDDGFTLLLFAAEPDTVADLEKGAARPGSVFECFFMPGDADSQKFEHYYQFMCQAAKPCINGVYPWMMEDEFFRSIKDALTAESHALSNGNIIKVFVPWEPLFDRLPFLGGKRDNIWRLSVIRWASSGGQTWGGTVHQQGKAGYMRFPAFTDAMKTRIMKNLLVRGWDAYKLYLQKAMLQPSILPVNATPYYLRELNRNPHTEVIFAEDIPFRKAVIDPMIAEIDAYGKTIAHFEKMSVDEQIRFYQTAAPRLYNVRYIMQQAYGAWQEDLLFGKEK